MKNAALASVSYFWTSRVFDSASFRVAFSAHYHHPCMFSCFQTLFCLLFACFLACRLTYHLLSVTVPALYQAASDAETCARVSCVDTVCICCENSFVQLFFVRENESFECSTSVWLAHFDLDFLAKFGSICDQTLWVSLACAESSNSCKKSDQKLAVAGD